MKPCVRSSILVALITFTFVEELTAQTTVFTYQGQLTEDGGPATGLFDLRFELFNAAAGGTSIGVVTNAATEVDNGLFMVRLDFGAGAFDGSERWLEIAAAPNGKGTFSTLSPRQPITAVPYAIHGRGVFVGDDDRVGIGTSNPSALLEVVSRTDSGFDNTARFAAPEIGGRISHIHWGATGDWIIRSADAAGNVLIQDNGGNVGIGTSNPSSKLHVNGSITSREVVATPIMGFRELRISGNRLNSSGSSLEDALHLNRDSSGNISMVVGGGNVGIGANNSSSSRLYVDGSITTHVATRGVGLPGFRELAISGNQLNSSGSSLQNNLHLNNSSSANITMAVGGGNVGIGTGSPGARLDVDGTTRTKVLELLGADVAERFPVSEHVEPGAVVEIDPECPGSLRISRDAYSRRVAGVVSGAGDLAAGAVLGNLPGLEDAPPIALSGRVWVHCDATDRAVEIGDLLTTSDTAGHAMSVTDYTRATGAILGKAMTGLTEGETGLVLVLVNLQ